MFGNIGTASAQEIFPPEFTPVCNECIHMLGWSAPDHRAEYYYEVYLLDESRPEDRRRIYKGPSHETFITVSGTPIAQVLTCAFGMLCSDPEERMLIPQGQSEVPDVFKGMRLSQSLELLHDTGESMNWPDIARGFDSIRAVALDLTATGQRGCELGIGNRRWNLGARMTIAVTPELKFKVRNLSVTEHRDGRWTWTGRIEGEHKGRVVLTTDDCAQETFVTIKSDAGDFAIQPVSELQHIVYRVVEPSQASDCSAPVSGEPTPIFELLDTELNDVNETQSGHRAQPRYVKLDVDEFKNRMHRLRYLSGVDRDHDVGMFLNPLMSLTLAPDLNIQFDLRHGDFTDDMDTRWSWSGCVAGSQDGQLRISIDQGIEDVSVYYNDLLVNVTMNRAEEGVYRIWSSTRPGN